MTWPILTTTEFDEWFEPQSVATKASVLAVLQLLGERGPNLGRPHVDTVHGSSMKNLKELRVSAKGSPLRLFFAFDSKRQAIILCGGDKTGDDRFYKRLIRIAEALFDDHEASLKKIRPGAET